MGHERLFRLVRPMNTINRILGEAKKVRPPTEREQTDPYWAYTYAINVIGGRWPEGEAVIATDPRVGFKLGQRPAERYLKRFPKAKREWVMRGWLDWFDL